LSEGQGIYIPSMIWDSQVFMTADAMLLSLASTNYDKDDYINDLKEFEKIVKEKYVN
jgi:hypothetical protein